MKLQIIDEKTDKIYSKEIVSICVSDFYEIDDFIMESFHKIMELKYDATMDFTGSDDYISYNIYEISDEKLFEKILDEWYIFILKYS
ncbi:MAG: hypothetical protein ACOC3V_00765 [bacterium]